MTAERHRRADYPRPRFAACSSTRTKSESGIQNDVADVFYLMRIRSLVCFLLLLALGHATLSAHDPGLSVTDVKIHDTGIDVTTGFALADAQLFLPADERPAAKWTTAEFARSQPRLAAIATQLWEIQSADGVPLQLGESSVHLEEGDNVSFRLSYAAPPRGTLTFRALQLGVLPPAHRQFVTVTALRDGVLAQKLLSAREDALAVSLRAPGEMPLANEPPPSFTGFFKLGVVHIWKGYDHLLFLFALLVVCRTFRSIVVIISCFTLAHSLTLALATLNVVNLPSRLVEPAIALSIVYVGIENLLRRGAEPRGRHVLTFVFGLIHGFGFASVLRELGVGSDGRGLAMPLFTFNLGVELGQIAIAAVVLPIVWQLRKQERFVRLGIPLLSATIALAGLWWLVDRTLLNA